MMIKVVVIGSGNVAQHLIAAFEYENSHGSDVELVQVYARNSATITSLVSWDRITTSFEELIEADLYIICVSDDAIAEVAAQIPFKNRLVAHTSGAAALQILNDNNRKGVFYPMQTFTKNKEINFRPIPICIESENATDFHVLQKVGKAISDKVIAINTDQRQALHVAAVFANNFTNHLYSIAATICQENQVPFDILEPLIQETAAKIQILSPIDAQTGPAKRNDQNTITTHLNFLKEEYQKEIYQLLTQSIQENGKKL